MASTAAVPFWRSAGMTYITYSNICASLVRKCLKEPHKTEAISREKVHFSVAKWAEGKPQKPSVCGIGQHNKLQAKDSRKRLAMAEFLIGAAVPSQVPDPFDATKRQHRYHTVKSSKKQETKYLRALRSDTPGE